MKHFLKPDQSIWAFEADGSQDHLITEDMTPIGDAELEALRAPKPPTPLEQLAELDAANTLTQRNLRDFILLTVEALKLGKPVDLSPVLGISKVIAIEAEAKALRSQL
jgi:hypothetical protein